jgi:hypothetical protein
VREQVQGSGFKVQGSSLVAKLFPPFQPSPPSPGLPRWRKMFYYDFTLLAIAAFLFAVLFEFMLSNEDNPIAVAIGWDFLRTIDILISWKMLGANPLGYREHLRGLLRNNYALSIVVWVLANVGWASAGLLIGNILLRIFPNWTTCFGIMPVQLTDRQIWVMVCLALVGIPCMVYYFRSLVPNSLGPSKRDGDKSVAATGSNGEATA